MPIETNGEKSPKLPEPKHVGGSFITILLYLILLNFVVLPLLRPETTVVPYSEFIQQVKADKVDTAEIDATAIRYTLKSGQGDIKTPTSSGETPPSDAAPPPPAETYITIPVVSQFDLVTLLSEHNVEFEAPQPSPLGGLSTLLGWVVPPLIFVGIWAWFLRGAQGMGANALTLGKSKARIYAEGDTGVTFKDVAGVEEAKAELVEVVEFLKHPHKYTQIGAVIPKGVLLVGPPGTGKTLMAKAVAGEAGVPFFNISGSEFIELFVGLGAARVRDLFQQAKTQAPCIVFIDELDALGKARHSTASFSGNDEQEQTLNQLLTEMDGFEANTGVIILAATNRPEVLDPALRRPGRFDRQVVLDHPDKSGREAILRVHGSKVQLATDVDLSVIAARTPGFAGADLANLINEAALLAVRLGQSAVTMADLNEAIERVVAGLERKSRILNPMEKKIVAYHEVGHAIVATLMPGANRVEKISIVPRGVGALGYTLQMPEEDRFLMAEDEIRGRLATLLGGRSAEEVVFGKVSTGASDDIQKATELAERMVTVYGMDSTLGPIAFDRGQLSFLENSPTARRVISPDLSAVIDREVQSILDHAHRVAQAILRQNLDLLEATAQTLLHQEVLDGPQLQECLGQSQAIPDLDTWLAQGTLPNEFGKL
ncbi:cell division protein FtsH [filamentous cyanobacterium CCP5]|nr:cell division protein FtsH [filamentous cyanobacterium CCP5]